jgi:putative membrane protein
MLYDGYHFWGMHLFWWLFWISMLIWIFATPYPIPFERRRRESPLDIPKRRLASGEITREQYEEQKSVFE